MICLECKIDKPLDCFSRNKNKKSGHIHTCKKCWYYKYQSQETKEERERKSEEREKYQEYFNSLLVRGLKPCSKCKKIKPLDSFPKDKNQSSGHRPDCKQCMAELRATEEKRKQRAAYRQIDYVKENAKVKRSTPERKKKASEYQKKHLAIPEVKERRKAYFQREEVKQNRREYNKQRMQDPKWRIASTLSKSLNKALKSCGGKRRRHWEDIVGYTKEQLKQHLEKLFTDKMNWSNYGKFGWHIDHIRPVASFNITSIDCQELKDCFKLENLQPLWWRDNIIKSDNIL